MSDAAAAAAAAVGKQISDRTKSGISLKRSMSFLKN
jgi:hypothetical protein